MSGNKCKAPDKYNIYYLDTNVNGCSPYPTKCHMEQEKINCQIAKYTPTTCSKCNATFDPSLRPNPYQCYSLCNNKPYPIPVNGCTAEQLQYRDSCPACYQYDLYKDIINNNGYLYQPASAEYTNITQNGVHKRDQSILNYKYRNPPNPPQVDNKDSDYYDPILDVYGRPYTF